MAEQTQLTVLGMMSGTSLDGIDVAVLRTDGQRIFELCSAVTVPYYTAFRARLRAASGDRGASGAHLAGVVRDLTAKHAMAVQFFCAENDMTADDIDLIGFHGHTVLHRPAEGVTHQIGDGELLARLTGIPVISDFRGRDVAQGGEGAPLAPLFHAALADGLAKPVAVLNLGGVANVTWIGGAIDDAGDGILAFDTGPGNALINDWVSEVVNRPYDEGGALARSGRIDASVVAGLMAHPFFEKPPPKSLDRDAFDLTTVAFLEPADGAATLTAFSAAAVAKARDFLPVPPLRWLVSGGGCHNGTLMAALSDGLGAPVEPVEAVGWNGDALEAQAFAYLAARSLYGLPLSLPTTTGVAKPTTGGTLHDVPGRRLPV